MVSFKLVECNEEYDDDDESDTEERFDEKAGKERIIQALKAHTWSNLELLEESEVNDDQERGNDQTVNQTSSLLLAAEEVRK